MSKSNHTEDRFSSKAKRFEKHNRNQDSTRYNTKYNKWENDEDDENFSRRFDVMYMH